MAQPLREEFFFADSLIIYHLSFIIYHLSFIIYHLSFIIYHLSFIIYYLLFLDLLTKVPFSMKP